ncbi:MAG: energy-coupled thiamine transporter ThiT [Clostridiales bacterium]|nr:energy-coupled thiamine transporter ThiT [Clostridiales bacterium]
MDRHRTRILIEIALCVALATVLSFLPMPRLPQGGTIGLSMIPLFVIAFRHGIGPGLATGALYGLVDLLVNPYIVHWVQPVLDYPLAYALVGLSGVMSARIMRALKATSAGGFAAWLTLGIAFGAIGRFLAHFVSGVIFFGQYAPEGQPVWIYSAVYNASFIVPSAIAALIVCLVVVPIVHRAVPAMRSGEAA